MYLNYFKVVRVLDKFEQKLSIKLRLKPLIIKFCLMVYVSNFSLKRIKESCIKFLNLFDAKLKKLTGWWALNFLFSFKGNYILVSLLVLKI